MIELHDGNFDEFCENIKASNPHLLGAIPRESICGGLAYAGPYAESFPILPKSKWMSAYDAMIGRFARQKYAEYNPVHQNQGPHPLCWAYSLIQHIEMVLAKMRMSYVQLAPESILGCNGFRDQGGYLDVALKWIKEHGIAPRSLVPQYAIQERLFDPSYKDVALGRIALEVFDLGTVDMEAECTTALLDGDSIYMAVNRMSHAMSLAELQKKGDELAFWTPNTWSLEDSILFSGRNKAPDEAYVVRAVSYPN
jgi:hypothetical protein